MPTTVNYIGSKWLGEAPDSIDQLLETLENYALDRVFEGYGNFIIGPPLELGSGETLPGIVRFWGNFFELSYVFSIDTDEPETIKRLTKAIRDNQARPDYVAQESPAEREAKAKARDEEWRRKLQAKREAQARAVLGLTT